MSPAQALFDTHMQSHGYQIGAVKGQWGLAETPASNWPVLFFWVAAAPRQNKPDRYYFRFDLNGYSAAAPTARPWDAEKNERLDFSKWPTGGPLVANVFKTSWKNGESLYAPCDREADLQGHSNWAVQHPQYYWQPGFTFVRYLEFLYDLLNSGDYVPE